MVNVTNFSNAVAAFTSGVVPGWNKLSPDHQKDQLLMIANNGFTATFNTKTVVGKSGAATFYTWFPAKPFMQGWWVQECAKDVMTVQARGKDPEDPNAAASSSGQTAAPSPTPQVGVDPVRARIACKDSKATDWKTVPYKQWSSIADELFRQLSLTVVAGIHVLEASKNQSLVADVSCPKTAQGDVDLTKGDSDGTITCNVTGTNLDKVTKLRLENAGNVVDPFRPEATVTVSGDSTTATAKFKVSDLATANGSSYNVFAVGKDGTETATSAKVSLKSDAAVVRTITPNPVDLANPPAKFDLSGFRMDKLTKVCFATGTSPSAGQAGTVTPGNATQASVSFSPLKLSQGTWRLYAGDCASQPPDTQLSVTVAGTPSAKIDAFTPTTAAVGDTVTITGSNLTGSTAVSMGGVSATPKPLNDTQITVVVPSGAKSGSIIVTGPNINASKDGFVVAKKASGTPKSVSH
jgi:IPT/TIG domain